MDLFLAISAGIGISLATGARCFLAPLVVALLARANVGFDLDGTDYEFLQSIPFMAAMLALTIVQAVYERPPRELPLPVLGVAGGVLGALEFAGALAERGESTAPGIVAGAVCALVGLLAVRSFFGGAAERLVAQGQQGGANMLRLYGDAAALATAALAVLLPPVSYLPLAFCIWVLISSRRRAGKKYEGLRVLR